MSKLSNLLIFVSGVAIGSAVTYKLIKTKYEQIAQEEIDSVKEAYYGTREKDIIDAKNRGAMEILKYIPGGDENETPTNVSDIRENVKHRNTNYTGMFKEKKEDMEIEDMKDVERPCVISPDEFGEYYDYVEISLTHYSDGVLTDEDDEIIEDVDEMVGADYAEHFGEYEDDSVFIRNDVRKCYYEILYDNRTYADLLKQKPYLKED